MIPLNGGPIRLPTPWTSNTRPYAQVKSSKSTNRTKIMGVNEKELANVSPKMAASTCSSL